MALAVTEERKKNKFLTIILTVNAEHSEEFKKLSKQYAEAVRPEKGAIRFEFYSVAEPANTYILAEEWESQEALEGHWNGAPFKEIWPNLKACLSNFQRFNTELWA